MTQITSRVGKRGTVVIPAALRRRYGIEEGSLIIAEDREEGKFSSSLLWQYAWRATP